MTRLSVNVNKLATLRNSRGKNNPDVVAWAARILDYGAFGITVHPRPDARHIRAADVRQLSDLVSRHPGAEFNVEGYPSAEFLNLIEETRPHQATLVPDPPDAITSDAGWDLERHEDVLRGVIDRLNGLNVRTSLFIDPRTFTRHQEACLARLKPGRCELYTESFAEAFGTAREAEVTEIFRRVGERVTDLGVGLNAGHDLSLKNVGALVRALPKLDEVSIGHALVCEALDRGMSATVEAYLDILGATK